MSYFPRDVGAPAPAAGSTVEWQESPCLLCGGTKWSPLVEAPDGIAGGTGLWFVVVQCHDCGLCFTNPRPSPRTIGRFYPDGYPPHRAPRLRRRPPWWKQATHWLRRPRPEQRTFPPHGQARLLDFGCGGGAFLDRMSKRGWQLTGLDSSAASVERVRDRLGLDVLCGTLPHPDLSPATFDLITMWHSLEHVHQPLQVLREAHRLLVPGGRLVVAVPNIDSLPFRWFGHTWYGLDLPRHLTHFASWTLYLMLHRAGFRVGPIRMVRHSSWLRRSARLASHSPQATRWHRWLAHKPAARLATLYSAWTGQADCMMVTAER
jgi:2-polyprenyl-3-methyl-5-hydroxy-6-metoxy-1,4-benzoquinol methylase